MNEVIPKSVESIEEQANKVAQDIVASSDVSEVKDLTNLFNLTQVKKNVLRVLKLNGLLDKISDEMVDRFVNYPGAFTNSELLNYFQVVQTSIEKANSSVTQVDNVAPISLQQNNVTINLADSLGKESRDRVLKAVQGILAASQSKPTIETEAKEIAEE